MLQGVCVGHWDPPERYAQATLFLAAVDHYSDAADKLIAALRQRLAGYELFIAVSKANSSAISYFQDRAFTCVDASIDTRLTKWPGRQPTPKGTGSIEVATSSTFAAYAAFHDKFAVRLEMYYHSGNLQRELARFRILALRPDGEIRASTIAKTYNRDAEIFGVFADEGYEDAKAVLVQELLNHLHEEMGALNEVVFFIEEGDTVELSAALSAGFEIRGHSRLYRCML